MVPDHRRFSKPVVLLETAPEISRWVRSTRTACPSNTRSLPIAASRRTFQHEPWPHVLPSRRAPPPKKNSTHGHMTRARASNTRSRLGLPSLFLVLEDQPANLVSRLLPIFPEHDKQHRLCGLVVYHVLRGRRKLLVTFDHLID